MVALAFPRASVVRALLTLALIVIVATGCSVSRVDPSGQTGSYVFDGATPQGDVVAAGDRQLAPGFTGELLDGQPFDSSSLAGTPALLNFWGSWCAPCRLETPALQTVYAELRSEGVQFLGVDVRDDRQLAMAFLDQAGAEYPSLFDPRSEVAVAFRGFPANVIPSTILLDADNRVAAVYTGAVTEENIRRALLALLEEGTS